MCIYDSSAGLTHPSYCQLPVPVLVTGLPVLALRSSHSLALTPTPLTQIIDNGRIRLPLLHRPGCGFRHHHARYSHICHPLVVSSFYLSLRPPRLVLPFCVLVD